MLQSADVLKSCIKNPASRIDVLVSSALQSRIAENKRIVRQIVRAILFHAKKAWPFEAMCKIFVLRRILVIFWSCWQCLLRLTVYCISIYTNLDLGMQPTRPSCITKLSSHRLRCDLCWNYCRGQKASFYSIMADEVSYHNVEHLPLCLRFVDEKCEIREEFIRFLKGKSSRYN